MRTNISQAIGAAVGVALWLLLPTPTPRARLNVAETIAMLFFAVLVLRSKSIRSDEPRARSPVHFPTGLALVAVIVLTLGFYAPALKLGFISDDYVHLWAARQPLAASIADVLRHGQGDLHLRPLGMASLFLDYRLWHEWAFAYHLINVALHLTAAVGVFVFCQTLDMPAEAAAGSALIFSFLPINAEAVAWIAARVAWIAARFDLLATSLTIWTVVLYARFRKTRRWSFYVAALVTFLLALFSKESAYVLPLFLFCFEWLLAERRRFVPPIGFLLLGAVAFAYRWAALGGIGGYLSESGEPSVLQFGWKSFEGILLRGPAQTLMGVNWLQPSGHGTMAIVVLVSAILLAMVFGFRADIRRSRLIRFGLLWMLFASVPVHVLLLIGPGLTNSRVLYLGSAGLAIALGALLTSIDAARVRIACTLLLLLAFGLLLRHNLQAWQWTSDFSRNFLVELRRLESSPPANAEFVLFENPDTIRGVFFFHVGISEAVKITYGRPDLGAHLGPSLPNQTYVPNVIVIDWVDDHNHPVVLGLSAPRSAPSGLDLPPA
jgi:hypothetical protein